MKGGNSTKAKSKHNNKFKLTNIESADDEDTISNLQLCNLVFTAYNFTKLILCPIIFSRVLQYNLVKVINNEPNNHTRPTTD